MDRRNLPPVTYARVPTKSTCSSEHNENEFICIDIEHRDENFQDSENRDSKLENDLPDRGKINANARNKKGNTPLHELMEASKPTTKSLKQLLQRGEDVKAKDSKGNTPLHTAAMKGYHEICSELISHLKNNKDAPAINLLNLERMTPLHQAVQQGQYEVVKVLLQEGADIIKYGDIKGNTTLHTAAREGHRDIYIELISHIKKSNGTSSFTEISNEQGETPLHLAVRNGQSDVVELLLKDGASIENTDKEGNTALHIAAMEGHTELCSKLSNSDSLKKLNLKGMNSFHLAVLHGQIEVVELLLENGATIDDKDMDGNTSLHLAAMKGHRNLYLKLIDTSKRKEDTKLNLTNKERMTPLHLAVKQGHSEMVELLLEKGESIKRKDKEGNSSLHIAAMEGHTDVCLKLIQYLIKVNKSKNLIIDLLNSKRMTPLHLAAKEGNSDVVKLLLESGANPNLKDYIRYLPLHYAAEKKENHECCKLLSSSYPNNNTQNETKGKAKKESNALPPLILAAQKGNYKCFEKMENIPSEGIDYQDKEGNTALHKTCKEGYDKFVKLLLERRASLDIQNNLGNTPIMNAISNDIRCFNILKEKGANTQIINKKKKGLLHIAAERRAYECMIILLEDKAVRDIINNEDESGFTALHIAIKRDCDRCALLLLNKGANPKTKSKENETPLHHATLTKTTEVLDKLLEENRLDLNVRDANEETPLHYAAEKGYKEACRKLLKRGARINTPDKNKQTVLHISALNGYSDLLRILIRRGIKKDTLDDNRATALHVAAANGHLECCKIILNATSKIELCTWKDKEGKYPFDIAYQNGHLKVFQILLDSIPIEKLHIDIADTIHQYMHDALSKKQREPTKIILGSKVWDAGLGLNISKKHEKKYCENFREIIRLFPDLAKVAMDKLSEKEVFDFKLFEDDYFISAKEESTSNSKISSGVNPSNKEQKTQPNTKKEESTSNSKTSSGDNPSNKEQKTRPNTRSVPENKCQKLEHETVCDDSPFYGPESDYRLKPNTREFTGNPVQRKLNHPVQIMIKHNCLNLLEHPLVEKWFQLKWHSYTKWIYRALLLFQILFVAALMCYLNFVHDWNWLQWKHNLTREAFCASNHTQASREYYTNSAFFSVLFLFILTSVLVLIEIHSIYRMRLHYLSHFTVFFRWINIVLSILALLPYSKCGWIYIKPVESWQCGVVAFLLAFFFLFSTINKLPSSTIFAMITRDFIISCLKGLGLMTLIIFNFAFLFKLLLKSSNKHSDNILLCFVRTVIWVFGDYSYDDNFSSDELLYPGTTNLLFLLFILVITIFIVCLLKGPALEPDEIRFNIKAHYANFSLNTDVLFPQLNRKYTVAKFSGKIESSKRRNILNKCWNGILTIFPWVKNDRPKFSPTNELQNKFDEHTLKLDQLLSLSQLHSEQINDIKHNYFTQNGKIIELKKHLVAIKCVIDSSMRE